MGGRKDAAVMEKIEALPVRMRPVQRDTLDLAAAIRTIRTPHKVASGPLLLELGLPGAEQIVASATAEELSQAKAIVASGRRAK